MFTNTNQCRCGGRPCVCCVPGPQGPPGMIGPTGPAGPAAESGLAAYGGLYNASVQLLFFTQAGVFIPVNLNTQMPSENISYPAANTLQIEQAGNYEIAYNVLLNASQSVTVAIGVRRNGVIIPATRGSQTLSFDNTAVLSFDGRLAASTIVTLAAGDMIDLAMAVVNTLPANLDAIINNNANAVLSVKKLNSTGA